jgi:hypothetical protein
MFVIITFTSDKRFNLLERDCNGLEGNTTAVRNGEVSSAVLVIINGTSFGGLSVDVCEPCVYSCTEIYQVYIYRSLRTVSCS